jgi:hypothetical protein
MPSLAEKKEPLSLTTIYKAAQQLSPDDKLRLRKKLFAKDFIAELKAFEKERKKRAPKIKVTDDEIVAAVKKIRARHVRK